MSEKTAGKVDFVYKAVTLRRRALLGQENHHVVAITYDHLGQLHLKHGRNLRRNKKQ